MLTEIAERRTSAEAADILRAPFVLGDEEGLLGLYRAAGIENPRLDTGDGFVRFPSIEEFVSTEVKGSPLDDLLSETEYEALLDEARDGLAAYRNDDGSMAVPIAAHIVTARKE